MQFSYKCRARQIRRLLTGKGGGIGAKAMIFQGVDDKRVRRRRIASGRFQIRKRTRRLYFLLGLDWGQSDHSQAIFYGISQEDIQLRAEPLNLFGTKIIEFSFGEIAVKAPGKTIITFLIAAI